MKMFISTSQRQQLLFGAAVLVLTCAGQLAVIAQGQYKPGDRVECNTVGSLQYDKAWYKGTVLEFRANDQPDGSWYRVKVDSNKVEYYCRIEFIRPIGGARATEENQPPTAGNNNEPPIEEDKDAPAIGDFVTCPVEQKPAKNGSRPNAELLKKLIRCAKREKAVEEGDEGAVKVDISTISIGAARPWSYRQDQGNGKVGTIVYPVKATYTVKTFYRTATEVEEGWIRILNFYVNAFGEWQIGSEENVKSPKVQRIQK